LSKQNLQNRKIRRRNIKSAKKPATTGDAGYLSTLFWVEKRGGKSGEFEEDLITLVREISLMSRVMLAILS
jgi:hypothetical protein